MKIRSIFLFALVGAAAGALFATDPVKTSPAALTPSPAVAPAAPAAPAPDVAALTKDRDDLKAQVQNLTSQLSLLQQGAQSLHQQRDDLASKVLDANLQISALQAQLAAANQAAAANAAKNVAPAPTPGK